MQDSRNIAIVGKMYAGKTTLAQYLVEHYGYTRVAMAGPLKALAHLAYGELVEKDKEYHTIDLGTGAVVFKSGRRIYQEIGQSLKVVDRDIWLKCFIEDTNQMQRQPYVVDDVRFVFEADYLREHGWYIVRVETPEKIRVRRAEALTGRTPTAEELTHESEREVSNIPVDFTLDGTIHLDDLSTAATLIMELANGEGHQA